MRELYHRLVGSWTIHRDIIKHKTIVEAEAKGRAIFSPSSDLYKLNYYEEGQVLLNQTQNAFSFTRKYMYDFTPFVLNIYFADGDNNGILFQSLSSESKQKKLIFTANHLCGEDLYKGFYDFQDLESFYIKYDVIGPQKDYSVETKFHKS